jgi:hypothetical protein
MSNIVLQARRSKQSVPGFVCTPLCLDGTREDKRNGRRKQGPGREDGSISVLPSRPVFIRDSNAVAERKQSKAFSPRRFSFPSPQTTTASATRKRRNAIPSIASPFIRGEQASGFFFSTFAAQLCFAPEHVPSGVAAPAAGLHGHQAAGPAGGRRGLTASCGPGAADAGAARPCPAALPLRVLAHGAPRLVQVQVAPQQLRVRAPATVHGHPGARRGDTDTP